VSPFLLRRCSDEVLGGRLASGEAAAFDELYRRYVHRLAAYGAHLLGDAAAGDDIAQSALLKAYNALRAGSVPERVKPWLYRIAHNTAIDLVARRREIPSPALPERPAANGHEAGALVAALAALPDRQRRVYVLRELHGLRIDETATELGLTTAQVEQSLFAARNRLAELLVFGDRLNCVTVQRLAAGPLDPDERRALKTHLRSCAACRGELGMRGRAIGLPEHAFDWLRGLFATLAGGGAPAAAKVGALVASASFVAGAPITVERVNHRAPLTHPAVTPVHAQHTKEVARRAAPVVAAAVVSAPIVAAPLAASPARHPERGWRRDDHEEHTAVTTTTTAAVTTTFSTVVETETTPEASPATPPATTDDGGGGETAPATVTPPPSQTTTTLSDDHSGRDGGSSGSGSDDGSGGGQSGKD
jgi:RNA polymerase sigma factor (sigma-70 family)